MKSKFAAAVIVTLAASAAPSRADDDEWEGDLDRGPGRRVLVVDGRTRRAVPFARLRHFSEIDREEAPLRRVLLDRGAAQLLRVLRADAHGLAWIDTTPWPKAGNWLVDAPGYAATHEFGDVPAGEDGTVELWPGREVSFRVLDAAGRPVAGAAVEAYDGCPHAPALARATSDGEGRVRLTGMPPGEAFLWIEAAGSSPWTPGLPAARTFVRGERAVVLSAGVVVEGIVVDLDGTPLADVLVRSEQDERGPAAMTGRDGRFRLVGVRLGADLEFLHPVGDGVPSWLEGDRWTEGVPRRVVLTPWEVVEPVGPRRLVRVRVATADGTPVADLPVRVVREEDGWTLSEPTDDDPRDPDVEDEEDAGESLFALPHGTYRLDRPTAWGEHEVELPRFVVGAGDGELLVAVRAAPRPRLALRGEVPDGATVTLAIPGIDTELDAEEVSGDDPVHLPADAAATLRVRVGAGTWFFPVDPARVGRREVTVDVPPPRVLRGVAPPGWGRLDFLHDAVGPCELHATEERLATWASGDLTLRFVALAPDGSDAERSYELALHIPADGASPIDVAMPPLEARRALETTLRVEAPEGSDPSSIDFLVDGPGPRLAEIGPGTTGTPIRFAFRPGLHVFVVRPGWAALRATIDAPGEHVLRWGDAAASIAVLDEDGTPAPASLLFDGQVIPAEEDGGPLVLRGLPAGPVDLVVLPEDEDLRPKALRLVLRPGETRTREVVLASR